jgi:membrane fusion protein (multidrug efflux system)
MFAKAEVELPNVENVLLIPATAITYAPYGDSVFVLQASKDGQAPATVQQKFVRIGDARGDYVVVNEGLKDGDTVITSGAFKLKNGMDVVVNNDVKPEPSDTPTPTDT